MIEGVHGIDALVAVANTRHGPEAVRPIPPTERAAAGDGSDRLRSPSETARFLAAHGIPVPSGVPTREQLLQLKRIREAVRALAEGYELGYRRRRDLILGSMTFRVEAGRLRPVADGWDGLIAALALPLVELRGHAGRLKVCHNPACGWVFIDRTRNAAQVWCTVQRCGDRLRVRTFRRRRRMRA